MTQKLLRPSARPSDPPMMRGPLKKELHSHDGIQLCPRYFVLCRGFLSYWDCEGDFVDQKPLRHKPISTYGLKLAQEGPTINCFLARGRMINIHADSDSLAEEWARAFDAHISYLEKMKSYFEFKLASVVDKEASSHDHHHHKH